MRRFFESVAQPLLELLTPKRIVEIGVAEGTHSALLADWCLGRGAHLDMIDTAPRFDTEMFQRQFEGAATVHIGRSLDLLPAIPAADLAFIDGDHNWYTVYHELQALFRGRTDDGPVCVLHDSGWPYGRRDLYYDPASVPEAYRQPWQRGPLLPHEPGIADYGLNAHLRHSLREGGPRNGVRTAIDDFLLEHPGKFRVVHVPVLFGLTVLAPTALLSPALRTYLDSLELSPPLRRLLEAAELERCYGIAATQRLGPLPLALDLPHAEPVLGRSFSSQLPAEVLAAIQGGTLQYQYRGRALLKSPFDLALYLRLLGDLRPRTVIEIGSSQGGSALWFADMMTNFAIRGTVITIDREQPQRIEDARISFLSADASDLSGILSEQLLANLPKPWLVVEDSAYTYDVCLGVLRFFDSYLASGDYIIVEDGIVRGLPGEQYRGYLDGPSRAIETFLSTRAADYEIDTNYCDFYGSNVTYCPNGWLRRR